MKDATKYIARKFIKAETEKIEDALCAYGTVILNKNTGKILTLAEMESLVLEEKEI